MRRKMVAGNWKMHGSLQANRALLGELVAAPRPHCELAVCVPFPYLAQAQALLDGSGIALGAQDCSMHEQGAYTGEVAAGMLREFGCGHVIVGHSERRGLHGENDASVAAKAQRALSHGLRPIVCVGETLEQREQGQTEAVVGLQLDAVLHLLGAQAGASCWPTSRCGPSAPGAAPARRRRRRCMPSCARAPATMGWTPTPCPCCTAAASSPTTRASCSRNPISTAA
jgi:triosephosphate isomerase